MRRYPSVADPGEKPGRPLFPLLFLDQTEVRRAEKILRPPSLLYLRVWMVWIAAPPPPPPLRPFSEGLYPPLAFHSRGELLLNLHITNDFLYPSEVECMEKYLDITKPRYSEQILPVPWQFVISRFHCMRTPRAILNF